MLGRGLRTHLFRFPDRDGQTAHGGRPHVDTATAVAQWFRGESREHRLDARDLAHAYETATTADQPSTGATLAALESVAMRRTGERVWLSGLATPQLVGVDTARLVSWLWRAGRHGSTSGLTRAAARVWAMRRPFGRAAALAEYVGPSDAIAPAYLATRGVFSPQGLARLLRADALADARQAFDVAKHVDARAFTPLGPPCVVPAASAQVAIERAVAAVELAGPLMSGALRDAEGAAVMHGLALRAPFLDHRLHDWVTSGGTTFDRAPLLALLDGVLPTPILKRLAPPAPPPIGDWLRTELRAAAEAHLLEHDGDGLFRLDALGELWKAFLAGRAPWEPVWSLVTARAWMSAQRGRTQDTERRRRAA
jgi:hypothetical protein